MRLLSRCRVLRLTTYMSHIDFIGIGAPKCGTTWFSAQLEAHPQIGFAPDKEVYYFADTILRRIAGQELRCFERGETWYHKQFPAAVGAVSCRGEFCPAYLYSEEAAARIAAYRPDIKLLLCLRPPVEMIYSGYWYNRNAVVASLPDSFEEMMENSFLRDLGVLRPPPQALARSFSREEHSRRSIRRDPARSRPRPQARLRVSGRRCRFQTAVFSAEEECRPGSSVSPPPIQRPASLWRLFCAARRRQSPEIVRRRQNTAKRLSQLKHKGPQIRAALPTGAPQVGGILRGGSKISVRLTTGASGRRVSGSHQIHALTQCCDSCLR